MLQFFSCLVMFILHLSDRILKICQSNNFLFRIHLLQDLLNVRLYKGFADPRLKKLMQH